MKKTLLTLAIATLFLAACGGNDDSTEQATAYTPPPAATAPAAKSAGEALIAKSDCIGCHRPDKKLIGPAYQDIAAKYEATDANIDAISDRIINGSKGIWGAIPMTPHAKITKDEAKQIVNYILSLKK